MNVLPCQANPCPDIYNSCCVFYEGENLIYSGINTNDSVQTAIQKIDLRLSGGGSIYAPLIHNHGNINNNGSIGTVSGLPIITGTSGQLVTGTFGTSIGTFAQGNDSRILNGQTAYSWGNPIGLYLPLTGGTMTGGIINSTSINPLTTLAESWIGPSSTNGLYFKNGNTGIGTTPTEKLTISGNLLVSSHLGVGNTMTPINSSGNDVWMLSNIYTVDPVKQTKAVYGSVTMSAIASSPTRPPTAVHGRVAIGASNTQNWMIARASGVSGEASCDDGAIGTINILTAIDIAASNTTHGLHVNNLYGVYTDYLGIAGWTGGITNFAGIALTQIIGATNTTSVLLGTTTIPIGNFGIYENTTYNNYFSGKVGIKNTSPSETLTLGTSGVVTGTMSLAGATSGKAIIQVQAIAGTPTLTLPTTTGTLALTGDIPTIGTWGALNYPTWSSNTPFVKMTAVGIFALDTNVYVTGTPWTSAGFELVSNKVISISSGSTDIQYPSAKLLYDQLAGKQPTGSYLTANQTITLGGILSGSGTTSITAAAATGYYMPSTTDQTNWNAKQSALTNPVTGTGTTNELSYWTSASVQGTLPVATYPSLTEVSYIKGLTSSAQTQLGTKAPLTSPTFATSITGSYLTASQLLATDASKNIVSLAVATYPSLTELIYLKGVTSAIQTQLNAKGAGTVTSVAALTLGTAGTDLTSTVATGTSTPVITLNVPTASATNRGVLSSTDWTIFNNKLSVPLNNIFYQTYDYAGNSANLIKLSNDNIIEFGYPVNIASLFSVTNAGLTDIIDIPVNSASTSGTEHGIGITVGGKRIKKISAKSDGAGNINALTETVILGTIIYHSQGAGDTVGDWRQYATTTTFVTQICTVANAVQGAGTWVTKQTIS